jgi:LysM repeat protein
MNDQQSCSFCDRQAEANCPRCGRDYCALHGDELCIACRDESPAVPSRRVFWSVLAGLSVCLVAGIWLLFASPRLPGEAAAGPPQTGSATAAAGGRASPTATAAPAPSGTPAATRPYTVQPGDTVASIAAAIGASPGSIVQLNPSIDPNNLQIDQTLRLPVQQAP